MVVDVDVDGLEVKERGVICLADLNLGEEGRVRDGVGYLGWVLEF